MAKKRKWSRGKLSLLMLLSLIIITGASILAYDYYIKIFSSNVKENNGFNHYLNIPSDADYSMVLKIIEEKDILNDMESFKWVAEKMNYPRHIHSGRYFIEPNLSNRALLKILRSGLQKPVKLIIKKFRTKAKFIHYISQNLEADSLVLHALLTDKIFLRAHGLNPDNVMSIFIRNTYEFYWNTSASKFFNKMFNEFDRFWDYDRLAQAKKLGLSPIEVIILASIVEEETNKQKEKKDIASVYLNRLNKGMRLQADPTVRFAMANFNVKRIYKTSTKINSPYNTYKHKGLPPGPICLPSIQTIDAVLNAKKHNYLYFCAKADFSGYHTFACTYKEHLVNASAYSKELNKRKIR